MFLLPIMSPVCLWALRLLLLSLQLWLLVQPAPIAHWARNSVQLTSDSHPSYLPTESPNILTPPADSRDPYNLGSSVPSKISAPSQELTDSLLPFLDKDSGQPSPKSKQVLDPQQDLPDKLIVQERLPEAVPVGGGNYNEAETHPLPLKRNLENDIAQHSRLATFIVGTEKQFAEPHPQKQPLQNDYSNLSTDMVYADNLPHKSQENPRVPIEPLQLETQTLETPEKAPFSAPKRDTPAQSQLERVVPSIHPGVKFSFPNTKEAQYSTLENYLINPLYIEDITPKKQQTYAQAPESAEEEKYTSTQKQEPAQPSELHEGRENDENQMEVPAYPEKTSEEVIPSVQQEVPVQVPESLMEKIVETLPYHEVTAQPLGPDQDYRDYFPNVTVKQLDMEGSINSKPTKKAEYSPDQHEVPSQPLGLPVAAETPSHLEEQTAQPSQSPREGETSGSYLVSSVQPPEFNEDLQDGPYQTSGPILLNKPHPSEQEQVTHYSESPEEVESFGSHLEDHAEAEKSLEEFTHPAEPEAPSHAPEFHMNIVKTPVEVTKYPGQIQPLLDNLVAIKVKPEDKEVAIPSETTKEMETSVVEHDSSIKPDGLPMEEEYPPRKEEQPAQPSESPGEAETSGSNLESSTHPSKVSEEFQPSIVQVVVPPQASATETSLGEQEHSVQQSESSQKVEHPGSHLENEALPEKYPEEATPPDKQKAPIHAPESPMESVAETLPPDKATVQPLDQDQDYLDYFSSVKVKPENYQNNLADFKVKPEDSHDNLADFKVKPEDYQDNLADFKVKPENNSDNLADFKVKPESDDNLTDFKINPEDYHDNLVGLKVKPEDYQDNLVDFKGKPEDYHDNLANFKVKPENYQDNFKVKPEDKEVTVYSEPIKEFETALAQQEASVWPTVYAQEVEPVLNEQEQTAHRSEYPEKEHPSEIYPEAPAQDSEPTEEFEPLIQQGQPGPFSEHHELIASLPYQHEAQYSNFLSMTVEPPHVGLPIKPEPTTQRDISSIYYEVPVYYLVPMNDKPSKAQQHKALPLPPELSEEVEPIPINQNTPALEETESEILSTQQEATAGNEHNEEVEIPAIMQEAPTQLPKFPMEIELHEDIGSAQLPKPHKTIVHAPVHFKIVSGHDQAQHSALPKATVPHLDVEINITPEPTRESKHSSTLKKPTVSLMNPEQSRPNPHQAPAQYPHPTQVTVQPFDLDLTLTPGSSVEIEPVPTKQETKTKLPTPPKRLMSQAVVFYVMPVSMPGHDRIQSTKPPNVPVSSLDVGLPSTPEPTGGAEYSPVLKTTAMPPTQPKLTFQTPVTAHPLNVEFTITQHSVNLATENALAVHMEQIAFPSTNICELCTCQFQALMCVGLHPKQRLHQVPVPDPTAKMKIFTTLNFHGNAISYTDENTWREYPWTEKLILSENHLTELRKDSFEGLLSVMVLDLSCNKIQSIERSTFEPLPFLKFLNLGCNLLTELSFGTFEAWHGMQFLHQLILNRNPLIAVEDIHLFKLPALKYLDMGRTQVQLATVENILTMTLELEKLVLPHQMAGCLCQYKNDIEVICKTVKLHCDHVLLINITYCLEEESIGNPEGRFMKVLTDRKRNNSTELIIEPEKEHVDKNDASYSGVMNEQLESNKQNEISSALNNILPYLSEGNLHDVRTTLLPFIKLLFSNEKSRDDYMDNTKTNIRPHFKPESNKNKLNKLNFLENLLNAEIQKKINEVKKKEEVNVDTQPTTILGPKFKRQIFPRKMHRVQPQENIQAEMKSTEERPQRLNRVLKGPRSIQKRHFKKVAKQNIWRKQSGQPLLENIAKERFRRLPIRELHVAQKPRKLVRNSLPTELSFTKELKAAASSLLKPDSASRASMSTTEKALNEVKNRAKTLTYTRFVLDGTNSRVKSKKASNTIISPQNYAVHSTGSSVTHRIPKAKLNRKFRKKTRLFRPVHANRPPFSGVRSLINSPSGEDFVSWGELNSQENTFPEFYAISNPSIDITPPKQEITTNVLEGNTFVKNIPVPAGSHTQNTISEIAAPGSSVTAFNLMPPVQRTNETLWQGINMGIDSSSVKATDYQYQFPSFGDHFEMQLNQQLKPLVPNNDVRKLLSQLIRTLKMDCSETDMQNACSKLISRSGLLMKLLSKSQEVKLSKAEWDTDQWKTDNYINESTEVPGERKESSELIQEVPGYGFNNKIILAVAVILVVMMLIIIFCLIEICCHRRTTGEGQRSSRGFLWCMRRQGSSESESQEGFFLGRPLWLRDMYRPLSATSKKNMAKKLQDKESSEEDEIFQKKQGKPSETAIEMPSSQPPPNTESENPVCCGIFPSTKN
ncbi:leucine-rich repeat-containing protein 37A-like isoform X2 [Dipodomys merriami]|uniref:leucine-rich repeat-containing protein 37A-like isoform X2 n=1 Tax=Dipodomys merriami TaxID=94247 RepID=UPI003855AC22